jgi:hypothetical protein
MVEIGLLLFFLLPFFQVNENICQKRIDEKYLRAKLFTRQRAKI